MRSLSALDINEIKAEAQMRLVLRRMDELRIRFRNAEAWLAAAKKPPSTPKDILTANRKAQDAAITLGQAQQVAARAEAHLAQIRIQEPRGWRRLLSWVRGSLDRHIVLAAKASEEARKAKALLGAQELLFQARRREALIEEEREIARQRRDEVLRSDNERAAIDAMERIRHAAAMLRSDAELAKRSVRDLLALAGDAIQKERAYVETQFIRRQAQPLPRPRW